MTVSLRWSLPTHSRRLVGVEGWLATSVIVTVSVRLVDALCTFVFTDDGTLDSGEIKTK